MSNGQTSIYLFSLCLFLTRAAQAEDRPAPTVSAGNSITGTPRTLTEAEKDKIEKHLSLFHRLATRKFEDQMGFGRSRLMSDFLMSFHLIGEKGNRGDGFGIELLGRINEQSSVVYLNPLPAANENEAPKNEKEVIKRMPSPLADSMKKAPTRALLPAEEASLPFLKNGKDIVWQQDGSDIRMVGALRAQKNCAECHAAKENEMLGALTYRLSTEKFLDWISQNHFPEGHVK